MRKIITTTFVTLDGVMQAPGSSTEDPSGGFTYGGWQLSYPSDAMLDSLLMGFMQTPFELLLGRTTYDIFAAYWPHATTDLEIASPFNRTKKYVVSHTPFDPSWNNSVCIAGDVVARIKELKKEDGPDLWVWGSGNLIQTLLTNDLIDRMHLWTYPLTIGMGKRLFADGTRPKQWSLVDSKISTTGVIVGTYTPTGPLKTDAAKA